jgi:hypothetical protein
MATERALRAYDAWAARPGNAARLVDIPDEIRKTMRSETGEYFARKIPAAFGKRLRRAYAAFADLADERVAAVQAPGATDADAAEVYRCRDMRAPLAPPAYEDAGDEGAHCMHSVTDLTCIMHYLFDGGEHAAAARDGELCIHAFLDAVLRQTELARDAPTSDEE